MITGGMIIGGMIISGVIMNDKTSLQDDQISGSLQRDLAGIHSDYQVG